MSIQKETRKLYFTRRTALTADFADFEFPQDRELFDRIIIAFGKYLENNIVDQNKLFDESHLGKCKDACGSDRPKNWMDFYCGMLVKSHSKQQDGSKVDFTVTQLEYWNRMCKHFKLEEIPFVEKASGFNFGGQEVK